MVSSRMIPDVRILCRDTGVRVQPGRGRDQGRGIPDPAGFGVAAEQGDTGTACLAPSEVVGHEHAEEDGQHAAGLARQHRRPQHLVLLDQAGRVVLTGGTAWAARAAPQPGPPVCPCHTWGQSDGRVGSWHWGGISTSQGLVAPPHQGTCSVSPKPPSPGPHCCIRVPLGTTGTPGPGGTHLPRHRWPLHQSHRNLACTCTGTSRGRSHGSPGGHTEGDSLRHILHPRCPLCPQMPPLQGLQQPPAHGYLTPRHPPPEPRGISG